MPKVFKHSRTYQKTRVIIDCSEVFIKRQSNLLARNITYSNYKHHNTIKFLVGITPVGAISFLSKCWGGRVSDQELTISRGFLDLLEYDDQVPNNKLRCENLHVTVQMTCIHVKNLDVTCCLLRLIQVMADRGFLIKEELLCRGASLVIPSFTKGKNQLRGKEVVMSRKIANLRIHVS